MNVEVVHLQPIYIYYIYFFYICGRREGCSLLNATVAMFAQQVVEFGAQTFYYYIEWRLRYPEELVSHSGRKSAGSKSETWPKDI